VHYSFRLRKDVESAVRDRRSRGDCKFIGGVERHPPTDSSRTPTETLPQLQGSDGIPG